MYREGTQKRRGVYEKKICSSVTGSHDGTEYDRMWRRKHRYYQAAPAETKAEETTAAEAKEESKEEAKESEATAEKAPEDYSGTVVVYSPHDADPLNAGVNLFMEKYPNVKVEVVAAGTGELCNRIAAESANPIADVLWGGGADSLAAFKDYFAPYVCANDDVIAEEYKDPDDKWIGESPLPMVLFYNKDLIEKDGMTIPGDLGRSDKA